MRADLAAAPGRARSAAGLTLLGGGAVLAVGAAVALVAALAGSPMDRADEGSTASGHGVGVTLVDRRFGVRIVHPRSWRRAPTRKAIALTSPNRSVGISITTAASRPDVPVVRAALEAALRRRHRARVVDRGSADVAGRPARLTALAGRNANGSPLHILAITVASRWRTYAIVSYGGPSSRQRALREARGTLASLQLFRPGAQ